MNHRIPIQCCACPSDVRGKVDMCVGHGCSPIPEFWLPDGWELIKDAKAEPITKSRMFRFICPKCVYAYHTDPDFHKRMINSDFNRVALGDSSFVEEMKIPKDNDNKKEIECPTWEEIEDGVPLYKSIKDIKDQKAGKGERTIRDLREMVEKNEEVVISTTEEQYVKAKLIKIIEDNVERYRAENDTTIFILAYCEARRCWITYAQINKGDYK